MKSLRDFINERTKENILDAIDSYSPAPNLFYESLKTYILRSLDYDNNYIDYELNKIYEFKSNFIETINKCRKSEIVEKYNQLINESLKSYSIKNFLDALYRKFPILDDYCVSYEIIDDNITENECGAFKIKLDWYNSNNKKLKTFISNNLDELLKLCKFYRYFISKQSYNFRGLGFGYIIFEPLDTEDVTKKIKDNFNGKVYHITSKEFVDSIKNNGLKIASPAIKSDYNSPQYFMTLQELSKNTNDKRNKDEKIDDSTIRGKIRLNRRYRNYTDRTFVFYTNNKDLIKVGNYVCLTLNKNPKDSAIIEIDLQGHKNPFFRDTVMNDNDNIHYAYSNIDIPPKMISKIIEL